ncbi:MAG: Na-translocating system protein MpsB, partial [Actinomycetota bacterium]|nr:Na-translocating system protein MpsB [Actinomycetota bacterium]
MTTTTPGTTAAAQAAHGAHFAHELEHWGHLLPSQGPMTTFVHHNTLHGLQHEPFERAVAEGERLLGGRAYEPVDRGRARYRAGRITDADLDAVFAARPELSPAEVLGTVGGHTVSDAEIRRLHLLYGATAVDPAVLRDAMTSGDAGRRIAEDVSEAARARLLSRSQRELAASIGRIGAGQPAGGEAGWTLADWLGALLGLDAPAGVLSDVAANLAAGATTPPGVPVTRLLRKLGIPAKRQDAYLGTVDAHCAVVPLASRDPEHTRRLWLQAEIRVVRGLARRHFGVPGTFDALEAHCTRDLEGYAVAALWHACLDAFGLTDPYGLTDPVTLAERDPDAVAERVAERFAGIERGGGPAAPLRRELRSAVRAAAGEVLD